MKSNVKPELLHLRARALAALGLGGLGGLGLGCKASETDGLVVAPMLEVALASDAGVGDASADASMATRPLREPFAPANQTCTRQVACIPSLAQAPTYPYRAPYERCDPSPIGETGHLSARETDTRRASEPDVCCYVSFDACNRGGRRPVVNIAPVIGRPMRDERGHWIVGDVVERDDWVSTLSCSASADASADDWAAGAVAEHASVGEFARLSLVLLSLGAPPELVADSHRAAIDEIAHARTSFGLAGARLGPSPVAVERSCASASLASLVRDTLRDGCYGETAGALVLRARARAEPDPEVAARVDAMASDEERHAELAWRIVRWAFDTDRVSTTREMERFVAALDHDDVADSVVRPCLRALSALARTPREGSSSPGA